MGNKSGKNHHHQKKKKDPKILTEVGIIQNDNNAIISN